MQENFLNQLDWVEITSALAEKSQTSLGRQAAIASQFAQSRIEVVERYRAISEMWILIDDENPPPLAAIADLQNPLDRVSKGSVLDLAELKDIRDLLNGQMDIWRWGRSILDDAPYLAAVCDGVEIDPRLHAELNDSFDPQGRLSVRRYPRIGEINAQIQSLKGKIQAELDRLVNDLGDALQETYVTQRNGRYVLPMRSNYKRGFGIAHGRSQSGETIFVEPLSVLPLSNQLQEGESALHNEIVKIRSHLSQAISHSVDLISQSNGYCVQLDLIYAKTRLGRSWQGVIPVVGDRGVVAVENAKHPILALKGGVVGNDLKLGEEQSALILSGPNAGGKTVALKTFGLFALLIKLGVPLPANEGARIDFFEDICADIGDAQDIAEGLSTFSGHLLRLQRIIGRAGPHSLVLLDELGMGTDPVQGAALAQAILEALVDAGSRVVLTTHFTRIKALPTVDSRYAVAATQFKDGKPTYRLTWGRVGESHALALGRRLGLGNTLLERATALCSEGEQKLSALILKLEEQNAALATQRLEIEQERRALQDAKFAVDAQIRRFESQKEALLGEALRDFKQDLESDSNTVKKWLKALVADPSVAKAGRTLEQIRRLEEERLISKPEVINDVSHAASSLVVNVGDRVDHREWGKRLSVVKVLKGRRCQLDVGGLSIVVNQSELQLSSNSQRKPMSNRKRKATSPKRPSNQTAFTALRVDLNTCDLRGCRVDEALSKLDFFFDRMIQRQLDVCFVLHGHGGGALKKAVRSYLPGSNYVKKWRPADSHEGGDAFSVVLLR